MEGIIRALQPDLMGYVGVLLLSLMVYFLGRQAAARMDSGGIIGDSDGLRKGLNVAMALVLVLMVVFAAYRVATYSSVNRVPRSDVDASAVYDRMQHNAAPTR